WISRLMSTGPGVALLATMVAEFRKRGILSLFEGLEEPWQLEVAERCEVDMVQGYVLARPEIAPTSFRLLTIGPHPRRPASPAAGVPQPPAAPHPPRGRPVFGHRRG